MARPEKGFQFFRRRGIMELPRKGTETGCCQWRVAGQLDFNLSPQGDGNISSDDNFKTLSHFNLSPQGDGNLYAQPSAYPFATISTYPRKGTVTIVPPSTSPIFLFQLLPARGRKRNHKNCSCRRGKYFNLSPQGDGNIVLLVVVGKSIISTYPRKGTETIFVIFHIICIITFQLIPARGRKHR